MEYVFRTSVVRTNTYGIRGSLMSSAFQKEERKDRCRRSVGELVTRESRIVNREVER